MTAPDLSTKTGQVALNRFRKEARTLLIAAPSGDRSHSPAMPRTAAIPIPTGK